MWQAFGHDTTIPPTQLPQNWFECTFNPHCEVAGYEACSKQDSLNPLPVLTRSMQVKPIQMLINVVSFCSVNSPLVFKQKCELVGYSQFTGSLHTMRHC